MYISCWLNAITSLDKWYGNHAPVDPQRPLLRTHTLADVRIGCTGVRKPLEKNEHQHVEKYETLPSRRHARLRVIPQIYKSIFLTHFEACSQASQRNISCSTTSHASSPVLSPFLSPALSSAPHRSGDAHITISGVSGPTVRERWYRGQMKLLVLPTRPDPCGLFAFRTLCSFEENEDAHTSP
jgi:hypothetical protein